MSLLAFIAINAEAILGNSLYIGMAALLLGASLGLPLPEDLPLLLGGCFCRLGYGNVFYVTAIGLAGVLFGDIFFYVLSRKYGMAILERRPFRLLLTRTHVAQMRLIFRRWGHIIIFFGRFFVGIRSLMCITAGICKVPAWKFILIDVSGAMVTVPLLVGLGWLFSDSISKLAKGVLAFEQIVAAVVVVAVIAWVIYIHVAKTRKKAIEKRLEREKDSDGC